MRRILSHAVGVRAPIAATVTLLLVVCSVVQSGDPVQDEEDRYAAACAAYVVLLAAHARGLAGYWRTPAILRSPGVISPGRKEICCIVPAPFQSIMRIMASYSGCCRA